MVFVGGCLWPFFALLFAQVVPCLGSSFVAETPSGVVCLDVCLLTFGCHDGVEDAETGYMLQLSDVIYSYGNCSLAPDGAKCYWSHCGALQQC